ncbi:helix-turn-helix domain-containing protein [Leptothoe spongobia]|uniref:Helix-turn-helix transcriptional regulator n=1 Tax=Leptothoe spongobia TAU-MAC 1115 TaxID=1967444 RepID=A0A947DHH3_9CYAN|nr:AraC family transcriptional regulator [Leptothoe spongobia]MBT9316875.1 helix-turn-helix transcriptional regulator [Leptothoe spongobia TAU-MAC 1115]
MALAQSQSADSFPEDSHSSESNLILGTETIQIEQLRFPPGEADFHAEASHTLFVNLTSRPQSYLQKQDGKTHTGLYRRGDMLITPANTPLFVRWEGAENCLQIQLPASFLKQVAEETLGKNGDRLTLVPTFQSRQQQLESISTLLLAEVQQRQPSGLYLDSLANLLAVQLLRNYGTTSTQLPTYEGGLPTLQLNQVLDYIDAGLAGEIKLADLAGLLNMSPFHFGRMFKQSMGISPHQYVIQQRLERAKHLLKHSDQAIIDIALECGFNSHSHLSKQFRKVMGVSPRTFRG